MKITNTWIGYIDRSFDQIVAALKAKFPSQIPEIKDLTDNNPDIRQMKIWAGITEQVGYYVDNYAREAFLATCQLFASAVKHARARDYRVKGAGGASTDLTFTFSVPLTGSATIAAGTEVQDGGGRRFFTTVNLNLLSGATGGVVSVKNAVPVAQASIGTSDGSESQVFISNDLTYMDGSSVITINSVIWTPVDTLFFSAATDTHYIPTLNEDGKISFEFGDGVQGAIPGTGYSILLAYKSTDGFAGNYTYAGGINTLVTSLTLPGSPTVTVNNIAQASGGYDRETIEQLRYRVPIASRTLQRAVTEQDYIDIASLIPGVEKAGLIYTCGKYVTIYIAPTGGGAPSDDLLTATGAFYDDRKMITTNVLVLPAGSVALTIGADIFLLPNASQSATSALLYTAMLAFLNISTQTITGKVEMDDVIQTMEDVTGVDYTRLKVMKAVPYARALNGGIPLDWTREIQDASVTTKYWKIVFTNSTHFQLFRDNTYLGTYLTGVTIIMDEIIFTINAGSYVTAKNYEFYTYASSGTLTLSEASYVQDTTPDLTFNFYGGVA